ncbi:MAG: beta-lactamase family protein [Desulfobacteraceae bacterium]|nr:beta-lactamase family protein [Desulfobacteraceae bacterium]
MRCANISCKYFLVSLFFIFLTTACAQWYPRATSSGLPEREYTYQKPETINDGWETASLNEADISSEKIDQMMLDILNGNDKNIHSVLLIKNGKLVLEEYFYGYTRDTSHFLASVSKSITSILIGIAIDQEIASEVKTKVYEFFPEYTGMKWIDQKYPITLQHLLTMSAGLDWEANKYSRRDPRHTTYQMYDSGNPIGFVLDRDVSEAPGKKFNYNSGLTILLGGIVKNTSGLYIDDFAGQYLFSAMGISDYHWDKFPDGNIQTDGGLHLRPRDMAKIGYMIMNNGKWKDRQIVSREWVAESTKKHIDALGIGYGYQWWIGKTKINNQTLKVLFASGHGGQKIFIIPELDLVAVFTSRVFNSNGHSGPEEFLLKYIIPSIMPSTAPKKAIKLSPKILDELTGKYETKAHGFVAPIFRERDKLYTRTSFFDKVELIPESETQFFGVSKNIGEFKIHFIKDERGNVKQCIAYVGFRGIHFDKIE